MNSKLVILNINGVNVGIAICEDLWNTGDNPLYSKSPALELKELGAEIIVNIAASPFSYNQDIERKLVLSDNASKTKLPIVYCNHVGAQTELIFDGGSFFMNQSGKIAHQESFFKECLLINDESYDDSLSIVKKYITADKRFKLLSQEKKGVVSARNLGIKNSSGRYIAFLDADDIWHYDLAAFS